jgi:protein TonB
MQQPRAGFRDAMAHVLRRTTVGRIGEKSMKKISSTQMKWGALAAGGAAALLAACTSKPPAPVADAPGIPVEGPGPATAPVAKGGMAVAPVRSAATDPRAYRADAATHLYGLNRERIWKGKLPPMLYAIGVLQVELDGRGQVRSLNWMRAPRHAPEVVAEIERTVRAAAPFPLPARMGKVVYTDTWLWHKSGQFQLDTLTEGQL